MDSRLAEWVGWLDTTKWSVFVLDRSRTLVWASEAFKDFLRERDDAAVGVGKHIVEAIASPLWLSTLSPDSVRALTETALPYFIPEQPEERTALVRRLVEPISSAVAALPRRDEPDVWSGRYDYIPAPGLAPLSTNYLVFRLREPSGEILGSCVVSMLALRPALLSLLARGDEGMYERMARLVTPSRHQTAILFADLQSSGDISRRMPTVHYFNVISRLTTHFDAAVAANAGIVGKHAGDGWTAFFLVGDAGSAESAAAGAVRTARAMQEAARMLMRDNPHAPQLCINAGLHWGPNLYMGQLVPGGRLDVTALGDEVNECARLQETARDGAVLASKSFMEVLTEDMCRDLDLNDDIVYQPLGAHDTASEKAVRDAGTIAVCHL
jgi:class 3 adenylate cyclase